MKITKLKAYAKVNLYLEVSKLLPNNYHYLHMLNARIANLYDSIYIRLSKINKVDYSKYNKIILKNNLCQKILDDFTNKYHINKRYHIYIKKRIPLGSGLGGGSMDAAIIYKYLLKDNNINISLEEQIAYLIKYGADIPYGLFNEICYVESLGEVITKTNKQIQNSFYLILPNISISTKEIFDNYNYYHEPIPKEQIINNIDNNLKDILINDLETVTLNNIKIKQIKNCLNTIGPNVMSGSGSSFLLYKEKINIKEKNNLKRLKTRIKKITLK